MFFQYRDVEKGYDRSKPISTADYVEPGQETELPGIHLTFWDKTGRLLPIPENVSWTKFRARFDTLLNGNRVMIEEMLYSEMYWASFESDES